MDDMPALRVNDGPPKGEDITSDEQLARWVAGEPVHSKTTDECCPDFSCCKPELLASEEIRVKFLAADQQTRQGFLGHFLGAAFELAASGKKVYVAGQGMEQ